MARTYAVKRARRAGGRKGAVLATFSKARATRIVRRLVALGFVLSMASCGSGTGEPSGTVTYVANVSSGGSETAIQLVRFTDGGAGSPVEEILDTEFLGYGVAPFIAGEGSVPDSQEDVPAYCLGTFDLGLDRAMPCWAGPVLAEVQRMAAVRGIAPADVTVIADVSYVPDSPTAESASGGLFALFDSYAEEKGFDSAILVGE